jgi:hypothetical protein
MLKSIGEGHSKARQAERNFVYQLYSQMSISIMLEGNEV